MPTVGTVISTQDSPNLEKIEIILNKKDTQLVERGQFLTIPKNKHLLVLGVVLGIKKFNAYYETLDSSIQEIASRNYEAIFPTDEWESTFVELKPLGEIDLETDTISRLKFPVSPGSKTYIAKPFFVAKFLGLDDNGIYWGDLPSNKVKIQINLSRLLRKHLAILAISGAGKSYAASILLHEIYKKGNIGTLVIDPHGEYSNILPSMSKNTNIEIIKGSFISIGVPELSAWEISEFIPEMSVVQTRVLDNLISSIQEAKGGLYDLKDIIQRIDDSESISNRTKEPLIGWLYSLQRTYLFSSETNPDFDNLIQPGKIIILDLADIQSIRNRRILVLHFLKRLFYQRSRNKIPPILFVIEEAHQFCLSKDTELLTSKGWKKYTEIEVGDLAFSYNRESKKLELAKIKRLIIRNYEGEMVKLFNENSIDALVTKDHRVLCNYRTVGKDRKFHWSDDTFRFAKNLPSIIRIPVSAEFTENGKCNIDNDLLKIIGWISTDGHIQYFDKNKKYFSYKITQSEAKEIILQEMTEVIMRRYPETSIYVRKRDDERINRKPDHTFYFKKKAKQEIDSWLLKNPHRIPREILEKADLSQLKILFNSMVQGDGNIQYSKTSNKYISFYAGKNKGLADDFQELCTKIGLSTIQKYIPQNNQFKVLVSFKRKFARIRKSTTEVYSGKVWDITINHGAFVARRNGKIFITGNCPQTQRSISKRIIETIAREGRKFYASLCLISQRPVNMSVTALSQCNTNLILRIRNPYDLDFIGRTSEGINRSTLKMLPDLAIGEALLVGEGINYPTLFKIRSRTFNVEDGSPSFEIMADKYLKSWRGRPSST
ncbi:MAG: helicase HerA domain-containing protein [Candidatus Hodarchaeota archaeon]